MKVVSGVIHDHSPQGRHALNTAIFTDDSHGPMHIGFLLNWHLLQMTMVPTVSVLMVFKTVLVTKFSSNHNGFCSFYV